MATMLRVAVLLGQVAALAFAHVASAQQAPARGGFWYAFGIGEGWAQVSCTICKGQQQPGLSAHLRLGGSLTRHVVIAGEGAAWQRNTDGVRQTLASLGAAAYWYPGRRRTPLYLKGGLGFVTHRAEDGTDAITSTGFGPQMGLGYEFAVGRRLFFAPFFNVGWGVWFGSVKFNGAQAINPATVTFAQLGLGLTGRP